MPPVRRHRITLSRRIVQFVFLVSLLYAGFVIPHGLESPLPKIDSGVPRTTLYERDRILWVSGKESVFDVYLPSLACRFVAMGGLFKSCSLHVLSENFTWRTSAKMLLPHVTWLAILSFLFARTWCSWVCPLGTVQDFLTWLRQRSGLGAWHLSPALQRLLGNTRHVLLWLALAISLVIALPFTNRGGVNDALFLIYCQICPGRIVYPLMGGVNPCWTDWSNGITTFMTFLGWAFLGVFLISFMVPRLWCRLCAVGALVGYFNRGGALTLEKKHQRCTSCGTCRRVCPVEVERVYREQRQPMVADQTCTLCLKCLEACPEQGCLTAKLAGIKLTES